MKLLAFLIFVLTSTFATAQDAGCTATDAERARWTMSDLHSWAAVMSAYRMDHGAYPEATTVEALREAVEPVYISVAPIRDAWGHAFRVTSDGKTFRIVSAGADGVFEAEGTPRGTLTDFNGDAVLSHGSKVGLVQKWPYR